MPWIRSCFCQGEKKKPPTISLPIQLLLNPENAHGPNHAFRCKVFKKPRPCHLCHQPILNQGSCCRVCKYVCHKVCESKEAADRFMDTSWQIHRQWFKDIRKAFPTAKTDKNDSDNKKTDKSPQQNGFKLAQKKIEKDDTYATINGTRKNLKIVKAEVANEANSKPEKQKTNTLSHSHHEPVRHEPVGNKMLASYSGVSYGEAFTTQPRSTKSSIRCGGTAGMDLSYVTERIIALWFPSAVSKQTYKQGQRHAAHMLRNKHGDNYMVFNLSEPKRILRSEHKHVKEMGWPAKLAPPLERICSICKEIESWLSGDKHRIAVLHARGSKDKLGVVVTSYMHYSNICGTADQALDRFAMRKYLEENIGPFHLPSNKRYVEYFAGLLSHNIKINTAPLYLTHVTVLGAPSFQYGGCRAFLKLYEGHTPIYTSGIYSVSNGIRQFTVNISTERRHGLQLRGDILVKCYHRGINGRETIFACQFHTCAVADYTLSFTRQELDNACTDARFPADGAVELHFSPGPEGRLTTTPAPTPAVPVTLADDPITRADSPLDAPDSEEDYNSEEDVNHTFGPLDGSIYATIAKKPELSPGAVSSPLTVSMDSGISSAGHQQNANTNASTSPPPTAQPSPLTPEDQHRELDELLSDMMLTVQNIPDIKPRQQQNSDCDSSSATTFNLDNVRYIDEEEDKNIPYHARQDSKPFTYGVNSNMIGDSKKLSSPSLVRKASFNKSSGDTLKKVQTQVYPDSTYKSSNYSSPSSNYNSSTYNSSIYNTSDYSDIGSKYNYSTLPSKRDPIDSIFTPSALSASDPYKKEFREEFYKDEVKRYDPLKRSHTDGTIKRSLDNYSDYRSIGSPVSSPLSDGNLSPPSAFRSSPRQEGYSSTINGNLTWLQRQQLKLKERREQQLREERQPHETRLLSELRQVHSRHLRPSASHRADGYTSDTTAFADDDEDFTVPLHINTTSSKNISSPSSPHSGSALRNFNSSQTSIYSNTTPRNERPFMAVKRAHEVQKYAEISSSPASILAANPLGNVIRSPSRGVDSTDSSGLLSLVEKESYTMKQGPTPTMVGTMPSQNSFNSSNQSTLIINETEHNTNPMQHDALADLIASLSNGSDTSNDSPNSATNWQYREESVSSWRTQSASEVETSPPRSVSPRPQTPAFPVQSRTPYMNSSTPTVQFDLPTERLPPKSPTTLRHMSYPTTSSLKYYRHGTYSTESKDRPTSPNDLVNGGETYHYTQKSPLQNGSASPTIYYGSSRRSSVHSESPHEVSPAHVKFVRDTSKFWYKPTISRDQAISMLRDQPPGTFVVRDSNSFPGAFGLALKVATLPSNVQAKSPNTDEYVRHFLIEPTSRGVRLKGCANEPVFSSLSALIYQHSVTQMALPCRLVLPEGDIKTMEIATNPAQQLFNRGAACNVLYLYSIDMESLTGPQAVRKAVLDLFQKSPQPIATVVHFKVNGQGITLTDSKRKLFFRRHYPTNTISHCGIDPDEHRWTVTDDARVANSQNRIFGFVARKPARSADNQCHLFAELEPEQPASAIVNFVNRILTSSGARSSML